MSGLYPSVSDIFISHSSKQAHVFATASEYALYTTNFRARYVFKSIKGHFPTGYIIADQSETYSYVGGNSFAPLL